MYLLKGQKSDIKEISEFIKNKLVIKDIANHANTDLSLFRRIFSDELNHFLDHNRITQLWDLIHLSESDVKLLYRTSFFDREISEKECLKAFFTLDLVLREFDLAFAPTCLDNLNQRDINTIKLYLMLVENNLTSSKVLGEDSRC
jgi:hypothetical protein